MKKILIMISLLMVLMLFASCDLLRPRPVPLPMPVDDIPADDPAVSLPADDPQGIRNNAVDFETVALEELSESLHEWAQETSQKTEKVTERMDEGEYTYILVGLGEQPTAGYAVEVLSIEDVEAGEYTITVKATEPEEDSMNAMVITYPAAIVRIAQTDLALVFVNEDGTSFIEE